MNVVSVAQSKFGLSDLTFRSIVELERMRAGLDFEKGALEDLSSALIDTSQPDREPAMVGFIDPVYYDSFERLYRTSATTDEVNVAKIQSYMRRISEQLKLLAQERSDSPARTSSADGLLDVCMTLHKELIQELSADDDATASDWPEVDEDASPGLCPA